MSRSAFEHKVSLTFRNLDQCPLTALKNVFEALPCAEVRSYSSRSGKLIFSYDASTITLGDCLNALKSIGLEVDRSNFIKRWQASLATVKDENIRANAKHIPHCCSKAPNVRR